MSRVKARLPNERCSVPFSRVIVGGLCAGCVLAQVFYLLPQIVRVSALLPRWLRSHQCSQDHSTLRLFGRVISHVRDKLLRQNRDLVFPDMHCGYFSLNDILRMFKKVLQEAGIPHMHFHDLRHSAATILLSMGVNMKVIQELLGHSDIAITLGRYSHLLPSMQKEAVDKWEDEFGNDDDEMGG